MCYGLSTCMYLLDTLHACAVVILHAFTMALVHACALAIVHVFGHYICIRSLCPTALMFPRRRREESGLAQPSVGSWGRMGAAGLPDE